jgi:hypothetical protein
MKRISITVAVIALAVAGCGSSSNAFKRDFNEAQAPLEQAVAGMSGAADPESIDKLAQAMDDTAARMKGLAPPADAKDEFDAFIKQVESGAEAMRGAGKAAASKDPEKMNEAVKSLQDTMIKVDSAQTALQTTVDR